MAAGGGGAVRRSGGGQVPQLPRSADGVSAAADRAPQAGPRRAHGRSVPTHPRGGFSAPGGAAGRGLPRGARGRGSVPAGLASACVLGAAGAPRGRRRPGVPPQLRCRPSGAARLPAKSRCAAAPFTQRRLSCRTQAAGTKRIWHASCSNDFKGLPRKGDRNEFSVFTWYTYCLLISTLNTEPFSAAFKSGVIRLPST